MRNPRMASRQSRGPSSSPCSARSSGSGRSGRSRKVSTRPKVPSPIASSSNSSSGGRHQTTHKPARWKSGFLHSAGRCDRARGQGLQSLQGPSHASQVPKTNHAPESVWSMQPTRFALLAIERMPPPRRRFRKSGWQSCSRRSETRPPDTAAPRSTVPRPESVTPVARSAPGVRKRTSLPRVPTGPVGCEVTPSGLKAEKPR